MSTRIYHSLTDLHSWITLRRFNNLLTTIVVLLSGYIAVTPFLPTIEWWSRHEAPIISAPPSVATPKPSDPNAPKENTLIVPSIALKEVIHEGPDISTLRQGVWKLPKSSTPDKNSNTVLAGHRFTYAGAAVFYNLDKVRAGDTMHVYWEGKRYDYMVATIRVVPPDEISVEAPSKEPILTVYTCTPLWSFKERLVIQAKLVEAK